MMKHIVERIKKYGAVIFFFVFTVCIYGSYSLYLQNSDDFWFTLPMFSSVVIPISLIILLGLLVLSWVLPETKTHIIIKLFFGVALAMYIQGNYINISYGNGVLDGTAIVWSDYTNYAIVDTIVWIVCLVIPFIIDIIAKKLKKNFCVVLTWISLFIVAMQIPALVSDLISYHPTQNNAFMISTDNMFDLSESENILIYILDTMDEEYYQKFIDNNPEYKDELNGFVHYDNAAAAGSKTIIGLPAMFTGKPYTRTELYSEYLHRVWSQPNAFSVLHNANYKVSVYSNTRMFSPDATEYIDNFYDEVGKVGSYTQFGKKISKMILYKFAPHVFKKYFWYYTAELDEFRSTSTSSTYKSNDINFYTSYQEKGFNIDQSADKVVQVYHLRGVHSPYTMNERGEASDDATLDSQVAGEFYCLTQMLHDLKDKGLYDNATIIITTDHGELHYAQYSMLLIKEKGSTGEYRTSSAPVSFFDLPLYLSSFAGVELKNDYGKPIDQISENEERERHTFENSSGNSKMCINEYVTHGHAGDYKEWVLAKQHFDTASEKVEYELGTTLSFTIEATGNAYTVDGFGTNSGFRTAMRGPSSVLEIPIKELPSSGNLKATITFEKVLNYKYLILANNKQLFDSSTDLEKRVKKISFLIPVELIGDDHLLRLEIQFPEIDIAQMEKDVNKRKMTGGLTSLVIETDME